MSAPAALYPIKGCEADRAFVPVITCQVIAVILVYHVLMSLRTKSSAGRAVGDPQLHWQAVSAAARHRRPVARHRSRASPVGGRTRLGSAQYQASYRRVVCRRTTRPIIC